MRARGRRFRLRKILQQLTMTPRGRIFGEWTSGVPLRRRHQLARYLAL